MLLRQRGLQLLRAPVAALSLVTSALAASSSCPQPPQRLLLASSGATSGDNTMEQLTAAGGCFWCVSSPYEELRGVQSVVSGFTGGRTVRPSYKEVCTGTTGHAEAVLVTFDPKVVSFEQLLDVFFTLHDPTQLNRQGNDHGTQYRSALFYHSPAQLAAARAKIAALNASGKLSGPVVTQLEDAAKHPWYAAEEEHQCFVRRNPRQGYVQAVSIPKLQKVRELFPALVDPAMRA